MIGLSAWGKEVNSSTGKTVLDLGHVQLLESLLSEQVGTYS